MQHCCFRGCCAKIFLQFPSTWFSCPSSSTLRVSPQVLVCINLNSHHCFHTRQLSWSATGDMLKILRGRRMCLSLLYPKVLFLHTKILVFILLFVKPMALFRISLREAKIPDIPRGSSSSQPCQGLYISNLTLDTSLTILIRLMCRLHAPHEFPTWSRPFFSSRYCIGHKDWLTPCNICHYFVFLLLSLLVPEPEMKIATRARRGMKQIHSSAANCNEKRAGN